MGKKILVPCFDVTELIELIQYGRIGKKVYYDSYHRKLPGDYYEH